MAKKNIKSKPAKAAEKKTDNTIKVLVVEEPTSSSIEVISDDMKVVEIQSQKSFNQEFLNGKISTESKEEQKQEEKTSFNLDMKTKEYSYEESCCLDNKSEDVETKSLWVKIKETIKKWLS